MKKLNLLFFALLVSGINNAGPWRMPMPSTDAFLGGRFKKAVGVMLLKSTAIMGTFLVIEKYPEIYEKLRWKYIQSKSATALSVDANKTYLRIKSDIEKALKLSQEDNTELDNKLSTLMNQPNALLEVIIKQISHTNTPWWHSWPLTEFIATLKNYRQELLWQIKIIEEKFKTVSPCYRGNIDGKMRDLIQSIDDLKRYIKNSEAYRTEKIKRDKYEEEGKQYRRKENIYFWMNSCLFVNWVYDLFKIYAADQVDVKEFMDSLKKSY